MHSHPREGHKRHDAAGIEGRRPTRHALLPTHRLRCQRRIRSRRLRAAARMAVGLSVVGAVHGRRRGRILLADAGRIQRRDRHRRERLRWAHAHHRRLRLRHAHRDRIRAGSRAARRRRTAADAALSGRGLAGRPARAHHGDLQRDAARRHRLQPRELPPRRRDHGAARRTIAPTSSASRTASAISSCSPRRAPRSATGCSTSTACRPRKPTRPHSGGRRRHVFVRRVQLHPAHRAEIPCRDQRARRRDRRCADARFLRALRAAARAPARLCGEHRQGRRRRSSGALICDRRSREISDARNDRSR